MKCSPKTMLKIGLVLAVILGGGFLAFPQFRPVIISLAPFALFATCPIAMWFATRGMNKDKDHSDGCISCGDGHEKPAPNKVNQYIVSTLIVAAGMLLIANAWNMLYKAHKTGGLATNGSYKYVRHPQYDGFLLVMIGYLLMWPTIITLAMFPVLVVMYMRLAKKEEGLVEVEHDEEYERYKEITPAFIPNLLKLKHRHNAQSPA